jgi:uncharacterized protein
MPSPLPFDHVGKRWQERVSDLQEYAVIRDGSIFRTSLSDSYLFTSEYHRALQLKEDLLSQYAGVALYDALPGEEVETPEGTCYQIKHQDTRPVQVPAHGNIRDSIVSDLTLIHGIGRVTERRLRGRGYRSIEDLLCHPKFRSAARLFLQQLDGGDLCTLLQWMGQRYPRSDPRLLETSRMLDAEDLVFLDLETLGLFSRPIILFGVGTISGGRVEVRQYLLRDIQEEPAALAATLSLMDGEGAGFVTFNGKSFDLPYLRERSSYYGLPSSLERPHFDILHFSRRRWKEHFPDCRLGTLERCLFQTERIDDIPSQMVPEFYDTYTRTGNPGPLLPIVTHNRQDVISLVHLYQRLMEEGYAGS